ncbi:MAG: hypothetical protein M0O93_06745 [Bacteroidales bacterium]|nr:hypothetical protein [Bacteroidales bacterium]
MKKITIRHKSSGHIHTAEIYSSFVYLIEAMRNITKEESNLYFEEVKTTK